MTELLAKVDFVELGCYAFAIYAAWVSVKLVTKLVTKLGTKLCTKLAKLCKTEVRIADLPDDFGLFPGHTS